MGRSRTTDGRVAVREGPSLTGGAVSTATDVYALGLLLFELLAGERPLLVLPLGHIGDEATEESADPCTVSHFAGFVDGRHC